ncbi:MAG: hypothetical protein CM1200mP12_21100 [Gammaproteobacteria bacterium]|nr:MAG: hypothetical protein CM1200mP12_21100 [Gammaproteobacteria bacterium]
MQNPDENEITSHYSLLKFRFSFLKPFFSLLFISHNLGDSKATRTSLFILETSIQVLSSKVGSSYLGSPTGKPDSVSPMGVLVLGRLAITAGPAHRVESQYSLSFH